MKITFLCAFLLGLVSFKVMGQDAAAIRLREEQSYKTNIEMTKVIVCTDDRSVWALSADGRVFYKLNNQADFSGFITATG